MIQFAPMRSLRSKIVPPQASREEPMLLRLQREALRIQVLLKTEASFGFDPDQNAWWFQTSMHRGNGASVDILFLLDTDYPVTAPAAVYLPMGEETGLPTPIACLGDAPEGWQIALKPAPVWRPNDDLFRVIEWLKSWFDLHHVGPVQVPVPLDYEI